MNRDQIEALVVRELGARAPEADLASLPRDEDLREVLDLDSIDFLAFVTALSKATGVAVPERDYRRVATLAGCVSYLEEKLAGG